MTNSNEQFIAGLAAQIQERGIDAVIKEMNESLATSVANWIEARKIYTNDVMQAMPESYRYRWCGGGPCACMGAANCSGGAGRKISYEEWEGWVAENPDPNPPKVYMSEEFKKLVGPETVARLSKGEHAVQQVHLDYD